MARTDTLGNFLTDVADAIREKKGTSETIQASNFDTEIENLPSGGEQDIIIDLTKLASEAYPYLDYAIIEIKNIDMSSLTSTRSMFSMCKNLKKVGQLNTLNSENMSSMFSGCTNLETMPILNTSKCKTLYGAFTSCNSLTDESLDNILQMCIGTTSSYQGTKTLAFMGFSNTYYSTSRIEALPHYQDFLDAGWTIGY